MIKVGILGARGRMGAEVVAAVESAADLQLVAALHSGTHTCMFAAQGALLGKQKQ